VDRIATINESAAIEITAIDRPFCLINIKLIIMKLLIKKALSVTCSGNVPIDGSIGPLTIQKIINDVQGS
jgi:hypothetical protein